MGVDNMGSPTVYRYKLDTDETIELSVEKYAMLDNASREFPYTDILSDDEVMNEMLKQIAENFTDYEITEWNLQDVPMGFGKRLVTCKFLVPKE